jgi:hypothetical protein
LLMCKCLCMHAFYILGEKKMTLHSLWREGTGNDDGSTD